MTMIPQLGAAVKPLLTPLFVKDKALDALFSDKVFAAPLTATADDLPADFLPNDFLPSDERVREVLENGGFTRERVDRLGRVIYSYERVSRDGQPLQGAEAERPPKYEMPMHGLLVCFCDCKSYRTSHEECKHMKALTWWLTGQGMGSKGEAARG